MPGYRWKEDSSLLGERVWRLEKHATYQDIENSVVSGATGVVGFLTGMIQAGIQSAADSNYNNLVNQIQQIIENLDTDAISFKIDIEKALDITLKIKNLRPSDPLSYVMKSAIHRKNKQYSSAIESINEAIKLQNDISDKISLISLRSDLHVDSGEIGKAINDLSFCIANSSSNHTLLFSRFMLFYKIENYSFAIKDLKKALKIRPSESLYYSALSDVYEKLGKIKTAIKYVSIAINLNYSEEYNFNLRSRLYLLVGEKEKS